MTRVLIDTNIVIPLEDAREVPETYSLLLRSLADQDAYVYVHEASIDDIKRDADQVRRAQALSKLKKYQTIRKARISESSLASKFGLISSPNDLADLLMLQSLADDAVDFLVSEDIGLHKRAHRAGLGPRVLRIREALEAFGGGGVSHVAVSRIEEQYCYQLNKGDPIFETLRQDYPLFDSWFENNCCKEHRKAWVVYHSAEICGLVIFKDESGESSLGARVLKICTFKISEAFRGGKLGEQLLRQCMWYAAENGFNALYLTTFEKQAALIDLLSYFGFMHEGYNERGELIVVKRWPHPLSGELANFDFYRASYPQERRNTSDAYLIPIRAEYHARLFPERSEKEDTGQLSLFSRMDEDPRSIPANSIRKVYVSGSQTAEIPPGSFVYFYMTQGDGYELKQHITTVGVVEEYLTVNDKKTLLQVTAKRSVYSLDELGRMAEAGRVRVLNFLLLGYANPPVTRDSLQAAKLLKGDPQSIVRIPADKHMELQKLMRISLGTKITSQSSP